MKGADRRFAELYDLYYRKILAYCRRRVDPDLVDDVVADTFLTAWRRIDDVPPGSQALPWLYAVAYRAIGHQYRAKNRNRRLKKKLLALGIAPGADSGEIVLLDHESRQVLQALSRLRPSDQELLRLLVWEELTASEIAAVLGISVAATKKRITRAKAALTRSHDRLELGAPPSLAESEGMT